MRLAGTRMCAACAASLRHLHSAQSADTRRCTLPADNTGSGSTRPAPPPVLNVRSASSQHQHPGPQHQHQHRHPFESARSQLIRICSKSPIAIPIWGVTMYDLVRISLCAQKYARKQQTQGQAVSSATIDFVACLKQRSAEYKAA